jgi:hypothetical protein
LSAWNRLTTVLRDNAGNICKVVFAVAAAVTDPGGSIANTIRDAILGVTKALSPRREVGTEAGPAGDTVAGTGAFSAVEDRAVMTFRADDNSTLNMEIPGPMELMFTTGTTSVDPLQTDVAAWISWVQDNSVSLFNRPLVFVKGERTRKQQMKH